MSDEIQQPTKKSKVSDSVDEKLVRTYVMWTKTEEEHLISWLEDETNLAAWKSAAVVNTKGRKATSARTKKAVGEDIGKYMRERKMPQRDPKKYKDKIRSLEDCWRKISDKLNGTGFGVGDEKVLDRDAKLKISTIKEQVHKECPHFDRLDALFCGRAGNTPPAAFDNMDGTESAVSVMFPSIENSPTNSETLEVAVVGAQNDVEDDDHGPCADKKLDGDILPSDDEEEPIKGKKPKEKTKPLSFPETILKMEDSKTTRHKLSHELATKKYESEKELAQRKQDLDMQLAMKKQDSEKELEKTRLELLKEKLSIKRMQAENERSLIQFKMKKAGFDTF